MWISIPKDGMFTSDIGMHASPASRGWVILSQEEDGQRHVKGWYDAYSV